MTDRNDPDPADMVDTDAQDWLEDRTRLLTDGRAVQPMTEADLRAEKSAAMAALDWDAILDGVTHAPSDWRTDGRWVA